MNARPDTAEATAGAQLPAEFRSALELAQAAVWDWNLAGDRFHVDEAWTRSFGVDVTAEAMPEVSERLSHGAPTFFIRDKKTLATVWHDHHGDGRVGLICAAPPGVQQPG